MRLWSSGLLRNTCCGGKQKNPWAKIGPKFGICCCFFTLFWNGCRQHMSFMSVISGGGWTLMFFLVLIFHDGGDPKQPLHGSKAQLFLRILVDPFTAHDLQRLLELVRLHEERFGCAIFRLWRLKAPGQPLKNSMTNARNLTTVFFVGQVEVR